MKRSINLILIALTAVSFSALTLAAKPGGPNEGDDPYNGNGSPSGPHYNLNILGMEKAKGKTEEETSKSNGRRIFVRLNSRNSTSDKILLTEGPFKVIDYDGTDGTAIFQLPNPDPDCDGTTAYSVFARALGGGGDARITTCASDGSDTYCSMESYVTVLDRSAKGKSTFTNVSKDLLYVTGDFTDDDTYNPTRYPLFGDPDYGYWWDYDNNGLRLAQLRFYEIETDVNTWEELPTECQFPEDEG